MPILDAGRATLEVLSRSQTDFVDEIEAGGTASGPVRLALEVEDSVEAAERLEAGGAERVGGPGRHAVAAPKRAAARAGRHAADAVHRPGLAGYGRAPPESRICTDVVNDIDSSLGL